MVFFKHWIFFSEWISKKTAFFKNGFFQKWIFSKMDFFKNGFFKNGFFQKWIFQKLDFSKKWILQKWIFQKSGFFFKNGFFKNGFLKNRFSQIDFLIFFFKNRTVRKIFAPKCGFWENGQHFPFQSYKKKVFGICCQRAAVGNEL